MNQSKSANIYIFTGWSLGEHGEWSKYSNFEVAVRVPLIFRIPKITYLAKKSYKEGQIAEVKDPVELVDLFPTLVDLVGLEAVPKCSKDSSKIKLCSQGKSLMPLIDVAIKKKKSFQRDTPNNEWEKYALSQYPRPSVYPTKSPDSDRPKLHEIKFMGYSVNIGCMSNIFILRRHLINNFVLQVRTQRYRYTEWITWDSNAMKGNWSNVNQTEFYDHHIDPEENLNLFGRPGLEDVGKMLARLLRIGFEADV